MVKTEPIFLNSMIRRDEEFQIWVDDFAKEAGLNGKSTLWLSLLVEETTGMVQSLMQDYESELWLEGDQDECTLYLEIVSMTGVGAPDKASAALKQQDASAGFMSKISEILACAFRFESDADVPDTWIKAVPGYMRLGAFTDESTPVMMGQWSLTNYREALKNKVRKDAEAEAALGELERSIVASIADDVMIGIRNKRVKMVISKRF